MQGVNYKMTEPCRECPFLKGSGFTWRALNEHASGEFPCHMASKLNEDGFFVAKEGTKTPHCAGALIFLEQQDKPHQMMRICERLGLYDRNKLNMQANVIRTPADCQRGLSNQPKQQQGHSHE
jgi:hypothetical protein